MKYRVLYNPLAGLGKEDNGYEQAKKLFEGKDAEFSDVTKEGALDELFENLAKDDKIVLCGGDGTLNKFVNSIPFIPENEILYYPTGNGNDFYRDVAEGKEGTEPCAINPYIVNLPTVAVNGKTCKFLNNVGFGIDGYCCETGDRLHREAPDKKISYTGIAIKGLLFHFKPVNAVINVDGEEFRYKNVGRRHDARPRTETPERRRHRFRDDYARKKQAENADGVPLHFQGHARES